MYKLEKENRQNHTRKPNSTVGSAGAVVWWGGGGGPGGGGTGIDSPVQPTSAARRCSATVTVSLVTMVCEDRTDKLVSWHHGPSFWISHSS